MAQHDRQRCAVPRVRFLERVAERRAHAERRKEVACDVRGSECASVTASGERHPRRAVVVHHDIRERRHGCAPVEGIRCGDERLLPLSLGVFLGEHHEPVGLVEGQGPKYHGVDRGEDRDVRANRERDGEDCGGGECRRASQRSRREPHVHREVAQPANVPDIAVIFARARDTAEVRGCDAPGLIGCHAEMNVLLGLELDVKPDLFGEVAVGRARPDKRAESRAKT